MLCERKAFGLRRLGSHSVLHFPWQSYGGVVTMSLQPFEETLHTCCNAVTHLQAVGPPEAYAPFRRSEIASCYNKSPFLALRSIYEP